MNNNNTKKMIYENDNQYQEDIDKAIQNSLQQDDSDEINDGATTTTTTTTSTATSNDNKNENGDNGVEENQFDSLPLPLQKLPLHLQNLLLFNPLQEDSFWERKTPDQIIKLIVDSENQCQGKFDNNGRSTECATKKVLSKFRCPKCQSSSNLMIYGHKHGDCLIHCTVNHQDRVKATEFKKMGSLDGGILTLQMSKYLTRNFTPCTHVNHGDSINCIRHYTSEVRAEKDAVFNGYHACYKFPMEEYSTGEEENQMYRCNKHDKKMSRNSTPKASKKQFFENSKSKRKIVYHDTEGGCGDTCFVKRTEGNLIVYQCNGCEGTFKKERKN